MEITQWRHYFHENLDSIQRKNTAKKVVELLKSLMLIKLKLVW